MNLFFTGLKHSGKTTFASLVAKHYSLQFKDSDDLISNEIYPLTIREFYKKYSKQAFVSLEEKVVTKFLSENNNYVLSLGGGACDNDDLMKMLKQNGIIIYLKRREDLVLEAILKHGVPPFLDPDNISSSFHALYERRSKIYEKYQDITIDLGSYGPKDEKLQLILKQLEDKNVRK